MTSSSLQGISNLIAPNSIFTNVGGNLTQTTYVYLPGQRPTSLPSRRVTVSSDLLTSYAFLATETHVSTPQSVNDAPVGRLSAHFTGRERDLERLEEMLNRTHNGIPSCCAVHGMPGVGKSQLSLCYAVKSFGAGRYIHIFWTSATSVDKLTYGFSKILDLVGHPDRYAQEESTKLTAARLWLEECAVNWLFIIDNVETSTLDFLRMHFPRRNSQGNVLFTTRTMAVAEALTIITRTPNSTLKLMTPNLHDSINLLFNDAGIRSDTITPVQLSHAEQLVESVGRLPLAVTQAACFIKETTTTLDDMVKLYKSDKRRIKVRGL